MKNMKSDKQKKYFDIYTQHLRKCPHPEIAANVGCSLAMVRKAIGFYRDNVERCSKPEELQEAIDLIKSNIHEMYRRLEQLQEGIEETTTREKPGGIETITTIKQPLSAEMALRREIRENEKLLFTYQGLLELVKKGEEEDGTVVIKFADDPA